MNKQKKINNIRQTYGFNTLEKTCYCQIKSLYNSYFSLTNTAKCIGINNMTCLMFSLEGTGAVHCYNNSTVLLPAGKVFFGSMKNMREISSKSENWHFLCYWYMPFNFESELNGVFSSDKIDFEQEIKDANELIELMQTSNYLNTSLACARFTSKIISLYEIFSDVSTLNKNSVFEKMIEYVNNHIKEKITTKMIAQEFGYCEKHIRYLFHKHLNTSPSKFIDSIKLTHIAELFQNTPLSLETLAEMYNYSSASHLIANFKKRFKATPKQYVSDSKEKIIKINSKED